MNPYRELVQTTLKIMRKKITADNKLSELKQLHKKLSKKLLENEQLLNSCTAFAARYEHWNQTDIESIKPVTNVKNPWLAFKREFERAIALPAAEAEMIISKELAWFGVAKHTKDWIRE